MPRELGEARVSIVLQSKPGRGIRFRVEDYELPRKRWKRIETAAESPDPLG